MVQWGSPPKRDERKMLKIGLTIASMGVGLLGAFTAFTTTLGGILPGVAGVTTAPFNIAAHFFDRMKHSVEATDELEYRAKFYTAQIYRTLGISNRKGFATVDQLRLAAATNPELAKLYGAPLKKEGDENRSSMMINGGIIAAGMLSGVSSTLAGVGEAVHHGIEGIKIFGEASKVAGFAKGTLQAAALMARDGAGMLAGGALAHALSHEEVDPQVLLEAIAHTTAAARAKQVDVSQFLTPQLIFALRVSQDKQFGEYIKKNFGKPFHKMTIDEQNKVMLATPALANAVTSEASAVAQGILQVQELGASKPNLNSMANRYAMGDRASSFASRVSSSRAVPQGGFAARIRAEQQAALANSAIQV